MLNADHIRLNFVLSLDSVPRPLEIWKYETIKSVKTNLRCGISCETNWTPQQVHYDIKLYNQHYEELKDDKSFDQLVNDGIIFNEDSIYMILNVNSGRYLDSLDYIGRYIRKLCIGLRPMSIREDANHNFMFNWNEMPPKEYLPPKLLLNNKLVTPSVNESELLDKYPELDKYPDPELDN